MTTDLARRMRGGGKLQVLFALAVTAALFVAAWRIIPVYIKNYQFEDKVREKCKFAPVDRKTPEMVKEELLQEARSLNLPITRENLQVNSSGVGGGIRVEVKYEVPVDLIAFTLRIPFNYSADSKTSL